MAAGPGVRVLIIDDLPEMRRLVELWLEETPAHVVGQASACDEAAPLVARQKPDLVVMDMNMPGRQGDECTRGDRRMVVVGTISGPQSSALFARPEPALPRPSGRHHQRCGRARQQSGTMIIPAQGHSQDTTAAPGSTNKDTRTM